MIDVLKFKTALPTYLCGIQESSRSGNYKAMSHWGNKEPYTGANTSVFRIFMSYEEGIQTARQ